MDSEHVETIFNFADENIGTEIFTTALTVDRYEAENLIKNSDFNRNGFMAEYFIKCPVEILLIFPCMIDIKSIVMIPKLMSHQSKCIEIYSLTQHILKNVNLTEQNEVTLAQLSKYRKENSLYEIDFTEPHTLSKLRHTFKMVGKFNLSRHAERPFNRLIFMNKNYGNRISNTPNDLHLHMTSHPSIKQCTHLLIRITWATIPVLADLKINAAVSCRNPVSLRTFMFAINRKVSASRRNRISVSTRHTPSKISKNDSTTKNVQSTPDASSYSLPSEFIDPITLELMTLPILLPSGKTIDRKTLDRYVQEQSIYGRLPSDPFTGVIFTNDQKHVPNVSLKTRIDDYLLKNPHIKFTSGVCGKNSNEAGTVTVLNENVSRNKRTFSAISTEKDKKDAPEKVAKRHVADMDLSNKLACHHSSEAQGPNVIDLTQSTFSETHEDELKRSLDLSLLNTIPYLPKLEVNKQTKRSCNFCKKSFDNDGNFYKLPCTHVVCRKCLQTRNIDNICEVCGNSFLRNHIVRIHQ